MDQKVPHFQLFDKKGRLVMKCDLKGKKCPFRRADGTRCSRLSYIGFEACWQHLKSAYHLQIKPSTIPGIGQGLFAVKGATKRRVPARVFRDNQTIIEYQGEFKSTEKHDRQYGRLTAPYSIQCGDGIIDCACRRGAGSLINQSPDGDNNTYFFESHGRILVKALRDIYDGEELFAYYGNIYRFDDSYHTTVVGGSAPHDPPTGRKKKFSKVGGSAPPAGRKKKFFKVTL